MKHAGQKDPHTYINHYQPNNSGTDGQGSYFGQDVRSVVNDLFRGLTLAQNPQLLQSLPAAQQQFLRTSPEFVAVKKELATLSKRSDEDSASRRKKLYAKKRKLADQEFRRWQKAKPYHSTTTEKDNTSPCYHRSIVSRVIFIMPERDRPASTLFETVSLWSPIGLSALRDMAALYVADSEVDVRPGLELRKC